jgi:Arc/MetJ-type ribon-helix-helix transcriptional regulator
MKRMTFRLPEAFVMQIDREARARRLTRSDIIRERLALASNRPARTPSLDAIGVPHAKVLGKRRMPSR